MKIFITFTAELSDSTCWHLTIPQVAFVQALSNIAQTDRKAITKFNIACRLKWLTFGIALVSSAALFKRKLDCRFYSILDMCFCSFVILWFFVFVISLSAFNVSTVCILPIPTSRSPWAQPHIYVCFSRPVCPIAMCLVACLLSYLILIFWRQRAADGGGTVTDA